MRLFIIILKNLVVSKYFDKIFNDYPPTHKYFMFPWEETYHLQQLEKVQKQARKSFQIAQVAKHSDSR